MACLDVTVNGKEWRVELEGVAAEFAGRVNAAWGGSLVKQVRFRGGAAGGATIATQSRQRAHAVRAHGLQLFRRAMPRGSRVGKAGVHEDYARGSVACCGAGASGIDAEAETYRGQLDSILEYVGKLNELDVAGSSRCRKFCTRRRNPGSRSCAKTWRGPVMWAKRSSRKRPTLKRLTSRPQGDRAMTAATGWTIASVRESIAALKISARELAAEIYRASRNAIPS